MHPKSVYHLYVVWISLYAYISYKTKKTELSPFYNAIMN